MEKVSKAAVRKAYEEKYGRKLSKGRMQLSAHGAGEYSIQIFQNGKLENDVSVKNLW